MKKQKCFILIAILAAIPLFWGASPAGSIPGSTATTAITVMTFNVRNANSNDGINDWDYLNYHRKDRAFQAIAAVNPDIICVQEAINGTYGKQVTDLQNLSGYTWYGVGRTDGKDQGEREGIMYRTSRFKLVGQGQFWISATPNTPNTTFATADMCPDWDAGNPRMATWVKLLDNVNGKTYFVLNQHWAVAVETQPMSAALVRQMIGKLSGGLPLIMTGDLNMTDAPHCDVTGLNVFNGYQKLLTGTQANGDTLVLVDAYRSVHPTPSTYPPGETTYHAYHGGTCFWDYQTNPPDEGDNYRIDFIFTSQDFKTTQSQIWREQYGTGSEWPSDHYPVIAVLTI